MILRNCNINYDIDKRTLEEIIYNIPDSIIVLDKYKNIILANKAAANLFNMEVKDFIGTNLLKSKLCNLIGIDTLYEAIAKKRDIDTLWDINGGDISFITGRPIFDEEGNFQFVIFDIRAYSVLIKFRDQFNYIKQNSINSEKLVKYLNHINSDTGNIIADSKKMVKLLGMCKNVSKTDSTVLIMGESGTGKELIAKYIHKNSLRSNEIFIPVNCSAIPHELMETEFFGYKKGAFTGADPNGKTGIFEMADGGTVFLDEIGEMPISMQPKLLRVLETGEIKPIGSSSSKNVNVRIIAATNRNLYEMVKEKTFREDLYYRLNIIPIKIPPLRDRKEEILHLAEYYLSVFNKKYNKDKFFSEYMKEYMLNYSWPGNVRELKNLIERLVIISQYDCIETIDSIALDCGLENNLYQNEIIKEKSNYNNLYSKPYKEAMAEFEKMFIKKVLYDCNEKVSPAAKKLNIHKSVLYKKIKKLCI